MPIRIGWRLSVSIAPRTVAFRAASTIIAVGKFRTASRRRAEAIRRGTHPPPLRLVPLLGEGPADVRPEGRRVALGPHPDRDAEARLHRAHRRIPPHADDADRRRHLLRLEA